MNDFLGIDPAMISLALVILAPASLWVIAIIDVLRSSFPGNRKALWLLVVLLVPLVGFIAYFYWGRQQKIHR